MCRSVVLTLFIRLWYCVILLYYAFNNGNLLGGKFV